MFGGAWTENTLHTYQGIEQPGDTHVGNDVWLGREAAVMPGVTVGGAVIGAYSVVTKDVLQYEVVAENPARHIRMRFDEDGVARLLAVSWWDWPVETITEHAAVIMAGTPEELATVAPSTHTPGADQRDMVEIVDGEAPERRAAVRDHPLGGAERPSLTIEPAADIGTGPS